MNGAKILILGVAYKQDIDDLRESPALKVIDHFEAQGAVISYSDPYIPEFIYNNKKYVSVELNENNLQQYDLAVITTCHTNFDYQMIVDNSKVVFDTKNATKKITHNRHKITKL